MMIAGFIPGLDVISDAYFLGRDLYACYEGNCDWLQIGIDVGVLALPVMSIAMVRVARIARGLEDASRSARNLDRAELLRTIDRADFPSESRASYFFRHGKAMGFKDADEYAAGARSLLRDGAEGRAQLFSRGSDAISVNPRTGRFAVLDTETGRLENFFEPDRGYDYVVDQIRERNWVRYYVR